MKKHISNLPPSLLFLIIILFIFIPYFTSDFLHQKQKIQIKASYQELTKEESVRKKTAEEAEQKIYLTGRFDPSQREDFVLIPTEYILESMRGSRMYLRKEALEAYLRMVEAANTENVDIKIASATRNFEYQKYLWNNKWTGTEIVDGQNLSKIFPDGLERFKKILEYSAVPGASRHHWGTDIDINNVNPSYFNAYKGAKEYEWLTKNAYLFGFCQTYNKKGVERITGYNEEKWHWSYLPLSRDFTKKYQELMRDEDIKGFLGDEYVPQLDLINNYVLSINPDCI